MTPHQIQSAIEQAIYKLTEKKLLLFDTDKELFYAVLDRMIKEEINNEHTKSSTKP